ncbi:MAG: hypothetical protein COW30_17150 [Rhodospirillales bacterium CG15_BIG_FIL_POST_REV_8_21_14_020_66_15]|nr:MAG: hypothetical protein COW30_17150 [Rhodospirillales bacterium CG15_BIG_FIL_POST_REV_8_21_14_020_66_15]
MKYALVKDSRQPANPGLKGNCPVCSSTLIAKCGNQRVWHWAHQTKRECDIWWENETEWHRSWKDQFPEFWQEVLHFADDGEKHIADIKTEQGWVIEFQHSKLDAAERRAREEFYGRMVWVVDGLRRKRDLPQFQTALEMGRVISKTPWILIAPLSNCALMQEWSSSRAPVFFDFGTSDLWCLAPGNSGGLVTLHLAGKKDLVRVHTEGSYNFQPEHLAEFVRPAKPGAAPGSRLAMHHPQSFKQYVSRMHRARSRFRF